MVAIDGPSGSGKSTVAREVGHTLGLPVLETGAMYRAVTLAALQEGVAPDDGDALAALADRLHIEVDAGVRVDGVDVTDDLRRPEVTAAVSAVAAVPGVRAALVARQRQWILSHGGGVVEGRDIGTVVAPDAALKVFLVAEEGERAARRHTQEQVLGLEATRQDLQRRDAFDAARAAAPLAVAGDAVVVDTTGRGIDEVVAEVIELFRSVAPG
ncbi:MAG: (d)CMP kinase [Actinomycetota bacterium]|nr:(d)CMP kinase [Actinomycetota bacterium]